MSELTYTSGVTGQVFDLDSKLSWGAANALRSGIGSTRWSIAACLLRCARPVRFRST